MQIKQLKAVEGNTVCIRRCLLVGGEFEHILWGQRRAVNSVCYGEYRLVWIPGIKDRHAGTLYPDEQGMEKKNIYLHQV